MKPFFVIALLFLSIASFSQENNVSKTLIPKDPGKALLYSMVVPGAGQMHNDQVGLGFATLGTIAGLSAIGVPLTFGPTAYVYDVQFGFALVGVAGLIYVAQLIHAPVVSNNINKHNGLRPEKVPFFGRIELQPTTGGLALAF